MLNLFKENEVEDDEDDLNAQGTGFNLPEPEIKIENNQIFVKRPWLNDILANRSKEDMDKLRNKVALTEEQRAARRKRIKEMEIARRKALKAAQRRAKMKKLALLGDEISEEQVIFDF